MSSLLRTVSLILVTSQARLTWLSCIAKSYFPNTTCLFLLVCLQETGQKFPVITCFLAAFGWWGPGLI